MPAQSLLRGWAATKENAIRKPGNQEFFLTILGFGFLIKKSSQNDVTLLGNSTARR
jgi:hypothetical protein